MSSEKDFFDKQIISLQDITIVFQYMHANASLVNTSSLLRAEYVLIVSAFDNYLHQVVRKKVRESFFGGGDMPSNLNFPISIFQIMNSETNAAEQQMIFDAGLKKVLEKDSYQSPKSLEYALSLINVSHIWTKVAPGIGDTPEHIKSKLSIIVKRRNQIAHEADVDYSTGEPRLIDAQTVLECREFLIMLVAGIDSLIS